MDQPIRTRGSKSSGKLLGIETRISWLSSQKSWKGVEISIFDISFYKWPIRNCIFMRQYFSVNVELLTHYLVLFRKISDISWEKA